MNEVGTFSINGCDLTNKDVTVTYIPQTLITNYEYRIIKDNNIINTVVVPNNHKSNIILDKTGNYQIEIIAYNNNEKYQFKTDVYKIDKEAPVIEAKDEVDISVSEYYDVYSYVKATDNVDGDITKSVKSNINKINLNSVGKRKLIYTVSDEAGNTATKEVLINVSYNNYLLNFYQIIIILVLLAIFIFLLVVDKTVRLEKRLSKYAIKPIKDRSKSLFDILALKVNKVVYRLSNYIERFEFVNKSSKKYQKYIEAFGFGVYSNTDFISLKIITSICFVIASLIIQTLRFKLLNIYELVIPLLAGYYLLDIIYLYRYYKYRKKIEKDLLQAIIIMNNCFKSGRSITQAVTLVSEQMEGAIADEFKKMSLEISFGLDIEEVFKRFANRIKLEEAAYLTSSLSVLNKTGGNIIKVFTSIEKTLFNRQKLNLELKSLTGSSKVIMYVLTIMPILFVILISFIDKNYFTPLFQSSLGFIIIALILILYISYILIVRKIMKVRM